MPQHRGSCHCGANQVLLDTPRLPQDQIIGACQCSFCRKHNVRAFSDPKSSVTFSLSEPGNIVRYRFALNTADVLLCGTCGVYVAMLLEHEGERYCTFNIDLLDERQIFTQPAVPRFYDNETRHDRIKRRAKNWCKAVITEPDAVLKTEG